MTMGNGVVLAVAGSKGGVGKTTTSINLSAVLAEMGYGVVLVELDLAMANVGDFLDIDVGLEGEDPTLHEVLAGTATVVDATYDSPCEFDVVPSGASLRGFGDADIRGMSDVLATLRFAYEVVVLDTGAGVAPETLVPLALADETVLVSSPRVSSVRDTMKTRDLTRQVGGSVAGVVFVRSGTGRSPGVDHIAEFLSVDLLGHVPEDDAVPDAQDIGMPAAIARRDSDAAAAYRELGERVAALIDGFDRKQGALSTGGTDQDGSGFSFIDADDESGGSDGTDAASGTPAPEATATNGRTAAERADGGREQSGTTTSGTSAAVESQRRSRTNHGTAGDADADTGDADVAAAVQHVDGAGDDGDDHRADTRDGCDDTHGAEPTGDTDAGAERERDDAFDESESAEGTGSEEIAETRAVGDGSGSVGDGSETAGNTHTEHDREHEDEQQNEREDVVDESELTETATVGADGTTVETDDVEDEPDGAAESTRSTAKRFIDRAVGMVDRGSD